MNTKTLIKASVDLARKGVSHIIKDGKIIVQSGNADKDAGSLNLSKALATLKEAGIKVKASNKKQVLALDAGRIAKIFVKRGGSFKDNDVLFIKAKKGDISILKDHRVDSLKDSEGKTPLHYLAEKGRGEVLNHPSVDKIKDNDGDTPLDCLEMVNKKEVVWN